MKRIKWILIISSLILVFVGVGFVVWANQAAQPMPQAFEALKGSEEIKVNVTGGWIEFSRSKIKPTLGFIIYPGGRVDYRAYAPLARRFAGEGMLVILTQMPLNLAVTQPAKAMEVIKAYPEVSNWVIGGHSLGGAMAANFVHNYPGMIKGLVLWAAYPAESDSLASETIPITSIYGTLDGLASEDKVNSFQKLLPTHTQYVPIQGGNHAQFGDYGDQPGDRPALISREDQQRQIFNATLSLLRQVGVSR